MRHYFGLLTCAILVSACAHESKKPENQQPGAAPVASSAAVEKKTEAAKPANATKVECSVRGDTRILDARAKGGGCEFAYTKAGKEGVVASSGSGTEYCQKALEKLRDKLKGSGYDCK